MRAITVSRSKSTSSGHDRLASAAARIAATSTLPPLPGGAMPMRSSIRARWSSVTGLSKATSRAAYHMCSWPPSSSNPASSRAWASNRPAPRWASAVPRMSSSTRRCTSGTAENRIMPPKPSTVPTRVSVALIGSETPCSMRKRAWATFG